MKCLECNGCGIKNCETCPSCKGRGEVGAVCKACTWCAEPGFASPHCRSPVINDVKTNFISGEKVINSGAGYVKCEHINFAGNCKGYEE